MAQDIESAPLYDPVIKSRQDGGLVLSDMWFNYFSFFIQSLQGFLTQAGIYLPQVPETALEGQISLSSITAPYTAIIGQPLGDLPDISGLTLFDSTNRLPKIFIITFSGNNVASAIFKTFVLV
jgi:hypothetical protein